jgi:hypothetical protein
MPRYYFAIRSGDREDEDERCAVLQDVARARPCLPFGPGAKRQRLQRPGVGSERQKREPRDGAVGALSGRLPVKLELIRKHGGSDER